MATTVTGSRCGVVQASVGAAPSSPASEPDTAITTTAAAKAPGTAQRRATRISTSQVSHHRADGGGVVGQRREGLDAQHEQDAGQHGVGQGRRDAGHRGPDGADQTGHHVEHAGQGEGADGVGVAAVGDGGPGEQRGARRRPGDRHRHPGAQREQHRPQAHRHADDEQPGGRLRRRGAHRGEPGQDDGEGRREPDEREATPRPGRLWPSRRGPAVASRVRIVATRSELGHETPTAGRATSG